MVISFRFESGCYPGGGRGADAVAGRDVANRRGEQVRVPATGQLAAWPAHLAGSDASEPDGPRAGHCDQLRAERAWAWLARPRLNLVQREGDREAAADPAVGAGARARHDRRSPGDTDKVGAGLRVDGLVGGRLHEFLVQGGDAEPERPMGQPEVQLAVVRRVD